MNNIAKFREQAGLTKTQLATKLGYKYASRIANYESDIRVPSISDVQSIVRTFNDLGVKCTIDDLFPPQQDRAA